MNSDVVSKLFNASISNHIKGGSSYTDFQGWIERDY